MVAQGSSGGALKVIPGEAACITGEGMEADSPHKRNQMEQSLPHQVETDLFSPASPPGNCNYRRPMTSCIRVRDIRICTIPRERTAGSVQARP